MIMMVMGREANVTTDYDGVPEAKDNSPHNKNPDQKDTDDDKSLSSISLH